MIHFSKESVAIETSIDPVEKVSERLPADNLRVNQQPARFDSREHRSGLTAESCNLSDSPPSRGERAAAWS
jgi:hypothetical protein